MKITFFDIKPYDITSFDKYGKKDGFEFKYYQTRLNEDTASLAEGSDAICVFVNDEINRPVIDKLYAMGIKMIALRCAGYNNVDIKYCYKKIHVFHVPSYSPYAIAEHAMALLLTSVRRIHKAYNRTRDFNFALKDLMGFDLHGKTVGVIGTGRIGQVFISICKGFGMNVLAYDKFPIPNADFKYVSLNELFTNSDIISLHCPLTEETNHIINSDTINLMKKGVFILNTSRGALIDAEALLNGIKLRKIGAACLDVYEEEADIFFQDFSGHIISDDTLARLLSMPNVIVTSHQAFLTEEALANIAQTTISNLLDFTQNGYCANELCYQCDKKTIEDCRKNKKRCCF